MALEHFRLPRCYPSDWLSPYETLSSTLTAAGAVQEFHLIPLFTFAGTHFLANRKSTSNRSLSNNSCVCLSCTKSAIACVSCTTHTHERSTLNARHYRCFKGQIQFEFLGIHACPNIMSKIVIPCANLLTTAGSCIIHVFCSWRCAHTLHKRGTYLLRECTRRCEQ